MKRRVWFALLLLLSSCAPHDQRTAVVIQRFFGACEADYGQQTDLAKADGECGIMTTMINRFEAENPDVRVSQNIVFWPGYDQLTAALSSNNPPDLVTMHGSVIADYQARGLLDPLDAGLAAQGIQPSDFTAAARRAVTLGGWTWGLPIDSWTTLWHVNLGLFRKAGLVRDGHPIMPHSPAELLAQARQFKARTGKPYFVQISANEYASFARNFYTLILQQGSQPFASPTRANFNTPQAAAALQVFRDIFTADLTTKNEDYSAAIAGFMAGEGGVVLVGTWMVSDFDAAAAKPGSALSGGYAVVPFPQLFARNVSWADGHNWVMPANPARTAKQRNAAYRFLRFFAAHDYDWSRTGHLPAMRSVIQTPQWQSLPHRAELASLAVTGTPLPKGLRRQFPIETIVGQEAAAAISGAKPISQALADMDRRVNAILNNL